MLGAAAAAKQEAVAWMKDGGIIPAASSAVVASPQEAVEHNTDQGSGTHELCRRLLRELGGACVPQDPLARAAVASPEELLALMRVRRERALARASSLAERARARGTPPAEAILGLLQLKDFRRGPALSGAARQAALGRIEAAMAAPGGLKMALLMMPFRDQHPLMNLGCLPDAGEVEALLRLWTLGTAVCKLGVPCKIYALRDARRYPCFWHIHQQQSQGYSQALAQVVRALSLDDVLHFQDVDDKGDEETDEQYSARMSMHCRVYDEELSSFMAELAEHRESLVAAPSQQDFHERLLALRRGDVLQPMLYPVLHSLPPAVQPREAAYGGAGERRHVLGRLLGIFDAQEGDTAGEEARRELLWQALVGAAKYISSYRSRSAEHNALGADDVAAVVPGALRLSIHNKGRQAKQFPVTVSLNPHRTPWHGSAELRYVKTQKQLAIDVKMAAEMWHTHVPVVPCAPEGPPLRPGDGTPETAWRRYCASLQRAGQPFFFAHPDSLPDLALRLSFASGPGN